MPLRELVFACDFLQKNESLKTEVSKSPAGTNPQEMDLSCVSTEEVKICDRREYIFTLFTHSLNSFRLSCPQRGQKTVINE